jgi:adenine-specific DNA-methyltransferase
MTRNTRLELTWIGKENRHRLEPRILMEDQGLSYHAHAKRAGDLFDNLLIQGDNLLALKALQASHAGQVKCVYIDPPFNTQQAFELYEDGLEHSLWLSLLRDRLELLHSLMTADATLFIHIDDNELAYLTVLADEIFGRKNRISIATFKQGAATGHKSINPGLVSTSNFILIYAKDKALWRPNRLFTARAARDKRYGQFIKNITDHYSQWRFSTLMQGFALAKGANDKSLKKELGEKFEEEISDFVVANATAVVQLARPDYKAVSSAAREAIDQSKAHPHQIIRLERSDHSDMYFVGGQRILFYSDKLKLVDGEYVAGEPLTSIWDDILSNNLHNEGGVEFPKGKKPEALIKRCIELATNPGDLVLDSFGGSGTTGAVAHKMGRRWIMVELGEHAKTHIVPRLKKVIDGEDGGGITKAVNWAGGGGFRFCHLAPSLLEKDQWGQWVISKDYNAAMLAQAMCAHMGFTYQPDAQTYWNHGFSSETDFIYVTTAALTHEQLRAISEDVGNGRTLLVCCKAFQGAHVGALKNLTVQKIPTIILNRCEWGRDDYSLRVASLPDAPDWPAEEPVKARGRAMDPAQANLFDEGEG